MYMQQGSPRTCLSPATNDMRYSGYLSITCPLFLSMILTSSVFICNSTRVSLLAAEPTVACTQAVRTCAHPLDIRDSAPTEIVVSITLLASLPHQSAGRLQFCQETSLDTRHARVADFRAHAATFDLGSSSCSHSAHLHKRCDRTCSRAYSPEFVSGGITTAALLPFNERRSVPVADLAKLFILVVIVEPTC
jgi:hypothetical protein